MKKLFAILIILSTTFLAITNFDTFRNPLNSAAENNPLFRYILLVMVVGTNLLSIYISYIEPTRKLKKAEEARNKQLKYTANKLITAWEEYSIRFNVMTVQRYPSFLFLDPLPNGKGYAFLIPFPRIFRNVWTSGHKIPTRFKLGIRQGSTGKSIEINSTDASLIKNGINLPMYSLANKDYSYGFKVLNLNKRQFKLTQNENVKFLFSIPMYYSEEGSSVSIFIGIFTLESLNEEFARLAGAKIEDIPDETTKELARDAKNTIITIAKEMRDEYVRLYF